VSKAVSAAKRAGYKQQYRKRFSEIQKIPGWQGLSASQIGGKIGVNHPTVLRAMRNLKKGNPEIKKWLRDLHQQPIQKYVDTLVAPKTKIQLRTDQRKIFFTMKKIKNIELYSSRTLAKMFQINRRTIITLMEKLSKAGNVSAKKWVKTDRSKGRGWNPNVSIIINKKPIKLSPGQLRALEILESIKYPEKYGSTSLKKMVKVDKEIIVDGIKKLADAGHEIAIKWVKHIPIRKTTSRYAPTVSSIKTKKPSYVSIKILDAKEKIWKMRNLNKLSAKTLAEKSNISERSVFRLFRKLAEKGDKKAIHWIYTIPARMELFFRETKAIAKETTLKKETKVKEEKLIELEDELEEVLESKKLTPKSKKFLAIAIRRDIKDWERRNKKKIDASNNKKVEAQSNLMSMVHSRQAEKRIRVK